MLQQKGIYLSASAIYGHLKELGQIEPYERRVAPWKSPRYEVWQRNLMWGSDWTKLSCRRSAVVFVNGDRFLFALDRCL